MIRLINPKYFMPFHGEYRMLKKHADIAVSCDIPRENTFVLSNGDVLSMKNGVIKKAGYIQADDSYVDGNRIGEVSNAVMKDRKIMACDGIVVAIINMDMKTRKLLSNPNIITRGFVLVNDNIELLKKLESITKKAIEDKIKTGVNYSEIKLEISKVLSDYINLHTGRKPIILPVIMDIKKGVKN